MKIITTIADYCKEIKISRPKYPFFDIRKFEDNMQTVNRKQSPFRHEFYAIALKNSGDNKEVMGHFLDSNLFFNSPYQIVTWDIKPEWKGWYIIFGKDFLGLNPAWNNFMVDYPFFRLDKSKPFDLPAEDAALANNFFERIFEEYHSARPDKFGFIQSYTNLLLLLTKRYFLQLDMSVTKYQDNRTADILLLSRFQTMIEISFASRDSAIQLRKISFYARKLNIHPNHLNAVTKRITGKTATAILHNQLIPAIKSLLAQTNLSIKEIAFQLHFKQPTHFTSFFKKSTGITPQQFRETSIL